MNPLFMTAYQGQILGPIAKVLGEILEYIYNILSNYLNIESVSLAIIGLTCFIYILLLPVTYKQQRFSVLSRKMQPELQVIQKKYKGKRDQQSMMNLQEEQKVVYDKYGISPTGSCGTALIQLPILYALFYVIRGIPAYIANVGNMFTDLVNGIVSTNGFVDKMQTIYDNSSVSRVVVDFGVDPNSTEMKNYIIDVLYKLSDKDWEAMKASFPNLVTQIDSTMSSLRDVNYLFILNISDTPWNIIKSSFSAGTFGLALAALLIPILSWASQMINLRLMPMAGGNDQVARQMKTMNLMMPIFSLVFTFSVPIGLGLYWITGALVRTILQIIFNKHFEKIDLDDIIEKNKDKAEKKKKKRKERNKQMATMSSASTQRSITQKAKISKETQEILDKSSADRENAGSDSLAAKANMVKDFNQRNSKR